MVYWSLLFFIFVLKVSKYLWLWVLIWGIPQGLSAYDSIRMEEREGRLFVVHAVDPGETLYRLAIRYSSSVEAIESVNTSTDTLQIGQLLYIPYQIRPLGRSLLPLDSATMRSSSDTLRSNRRALPQTPSQWSSDSLFLRPYRFRVTEEEGVARPLTTQGDRLFALHRRAPLGTFIRVENQINKQSLLVRVIGRIPEIDQNQKTLLQLSTKAYQLLRSPDRWTRVTIVYLSNSE